MFKASWSKEGGTISFWTLFVVTLLTLTWARGAAVWRTHFCLRANFEQSGWRFSTIFNIGGAFLQKRSIGPPGDERMKAHHAQVLDRLVTTKGDKRFRERLNERSCKVLIKNTSP
jgi:hypothetical protein